MGQPHSHSRGPLHCTGAFATTRSDLCFWSEAASNVRHCSVCDGAAILQVDWQSVTLLRPNKCSHQSNGTLQQLWLCSLVAVSVHCSKACTAGSVHPQQWNDAEDVHMTDQDNIMWQPHETDMCQEDEVQDQPERRPQLAIAIGRVWSDITRLVVLHCTH